MAPCRLTTQISPLSTPPKTHFKENKSSLKVAFSNPVRPNRGKTSEYEANYAPKYKAVGFLIILCIFVTVAELSSVRRPKYKYSYILNLWSFSRFQI
ncbi:hypothetical protein BDZ94DRAFT_1265939 [Collybia nuda]|uniref:Uncharacterized protein n=1 Tax=Collybia nuda TaxID=64659 RepID=A0A9P5Y193_9AGAR|nr:hypothetical protein BDZ94DRAFT_1265939 [Collybia nuda]